MKLRSKTTISEHFSAIKDPRLERTKLHQLIDIITITLCAVISGAESWSDIELFGQCKYDWFKSFLEGCGQMSLVKSDCPKGSGGANRHVTDSLT